MPAIGAETAVPAFDAEAAVPAFDAEALVQLAYRSVLRRDADPDGLTAYAACLREGCGFDWLVATLAASDEFARASSPVAAAPAIGPSVGLDFPLDAAPPLMIQTECAPADLQALWDRVAATWSGLGETEPYWSVLTEDRFLAERMGGPALAAFHATGEGDAARLDAWLHRAGLALPSQGVCAEYGCGVGRITQALARRFRAVIGFDVSAPHLRAARGQLDAEGIGNVRLVPVRGPAELDALSGIDVFYSIISLQHSAPPIIMDVLRHAFAGLNPGGVAFFQVPTYGSGYAFPSAAANQDGMEMHVVPQHVVHEAAHTAGLRVLEVQPDWCVGRPGEWISSTFLFIKG